MSKIDICCTRCSHQHVCSKKSEFREVVETVHNLELKSHNPREERGVPVRDISFIRPITVECKFFSKTVVSPREMGDVWT